MTKRKPHEIGMRDDEYRDIARIMVNDTDRVEDNAQVMRVEDGAFVEAWIWVPKTISGAE